MSIPPDSAKVVECIRRDHAFRITRIVALRFLGFVGLFGDIIFVAIDIHYDKC